MLRLRGGSFGIRVGDKYIQFKLIFPLVEGLFNLLTETVSLSNWQMKTTVLSKELESSVYMIMLSPVPPQQSYY